MLQPTPVETARRVQQLRSVAICTMLAAFAFLQEPGRIAPDTKLDLVVDPARFLGRALHLWEPNGFFGQVQNQGYGYLFPMGPFFLLGKLAALPPWVVQRLWWTLLLCLAFGGTVRLARAMSLGTDATRLFAGLVYALSPRMLTVMGATSVEALPMAIAPWVLLPLVLATTGKLSLRRGAALSGVALLCAGAVNAAATAAVLPLPVLWILTRHRSPDRRRLAVLWSAAVVAASAWWVVPLLLLGRYSPPFLDYIESASVTTGITTPFEVLRGGSHWLAYLSSTDGPILPAGWLVLTTPMLVLDTALIAAVGLLGLHARRLPERTWLVLGVAAGVVLLGAGHVATGAAAAADAPWSGALRELMDGPLAPLRNVHKFDPVLRLPLALSVAYLAAELLRWARARQDAVLAVGTTVLTGVALLAGSAAPLLTTRLVADGTFADVPGYWRQTAGWLAEPDHQGRALLLPSSRFGVYSWGHPHDEPLQTLATTPWGVRDAIPLAPAGHIRYLDAIDQVLADGSGSPGLAAYLARGGVRWLVVRNDLDWARADATRPVVVHQALSRSSGITRVASFGPTVGGDSNVFRDNDQRLGRAYPAVEIFEVAGGGHRADVYDAGDTLEVSGGPEALLALAARGWLAGRPIVFAGDRTAALTPPNAVVTDQLLRRERNFGSSDYAVSQVLTADDPVRNDAAARDYLPWPGREHETMARIEGLRRLSASSSSSDANAFGGGKPEHQPFAAVDGDSATSWLSAPSTDSRGAWLQLDLSRPVSSGSVQIRFDRRSPGDPVARVRIDLGARHVSRQVEPAGFVSVPVTSPIRRLRVTAERFADGQPGLVLGISEITVPGQRFSRTLLTPGDVRAVSGTVRIALDHTADGRPGCLQDGSQAQCAAGLARPDEEVDLDRTVQLAQPLSGRVQLSVTPRPGPALSAWLRNSTPGVRVVASSSEVSDPVGDGQAVADGNASTGWVAAADDNAPELDVTLPKTQLVSGLQVTSSAALSASGAKEVQVSSESGVRNAPLDDDGHATFEALRGRRFTVSFPVVAPRESFDPQTRLVTVRPVGLSELRLVSATDGSTAPAGARAADVRLTTPCGDGPTLQVGATTLDTRVESTLGDVRALVPARAVPCGSDAASLPTGRSRIVATATPLWQPTAISVEAAGGTARAAPPVQPEVRAWGADSRRVTLPASDTARVLVVHENENVGWRATMDGHRLARVVIDGWQQGYVVPASAAGPVTLVHEGDRPYRLGLALGLALAVLLVVAAAVPSRARAARELGPGTSRPALRGLLATGVLLAFGGWLGLAAGAGLVGLAVALGRLPRVRRSMYVEGGLAAISLLTMTAAGGLAALRPWGVSGDYAGNELPAAALAVVSLSAALVAWVLSGDPGGPVGSPGAARLRQRMAGRSTKR